ncbi:MAG TPA: signal peptidase I [Burkholderiaceae bacterium]|nr:signal peptidase I [Burkholderiaceae bacterium]
MRAWLRRNRGFLVFLVGFGLFRTAIADWNPIPSGSMRPTLLEGDVVWVNRLAYDVKVPLTNTSLATTGEPKRGDIVTFSSPKDGTRLIKRLVALPGDTVELRDDVLLVNGQAAEYMNPSHVKEAIGGGLVVDAERATEVLAGSRRTVQVLPHVGAKRSFGPVAVPPNHYFMLGDNRDNSLDSRYIGFVSRELLIGRAERIVVSADITGSWLPRIERTAAKLQ